MSALIRAPWQTAAPVAVLWGLMGAIGVAYVAITIRRMQVQTTYKPQFEDWLFHSLLPLGAYMILGLSALTVGSYPRESLFGVGTSAVSLLFIGIHNAWDMITYHVFDETDQETGKIERADTNTEKTKNGKQRKHK